MKWATRWLRARWPGAAGMQSQEAVAARAAAVIDKVIFDLGVARLVQGTVRLDPGFRPRFQSNVPTPRPKVLAVVPLAEIAKAVPLVTTEGDDIEVLEPHTAALVDALLQEFRLQSPRFRALPTR